MAATLIYGRRIQAFQCHNKALYNRHWPRCQRARVPDGRYESMLRRMGILLKTRTLSSTATKKYQSLGLSIEPL